MSKRHSAEGTSIGQPNCVKFSNRRSCKPVNRKKRFLVIDQGAIVFDTHQKRLALAFHMGRQSATAMICKVINTDYGK